MKRHWDEQELAQRWSLTHNEFELVRNRTERSRIGFAALLKFFQVEGRFPSDRREVPTLALEFLAGQLEVAREGFGDYDLGSRSAKRDRVQIRELLGFRQIRVDDSKELADWLNGEVLPVDHNPEHLREAALEWCRKNRIEPPTPSRMERILGSALRAYETEFFEVSYEKIPEECRTALVALLLVPEASNDTGRETSPFSELRADPGRVSLESILKEIAKLKRIAAVALPDDLFALVPSKILQKYRVRAAGERPSQLRRHAGPTRYTLLAAFCWERQKDIIDGLVDLLIQVVHRIGARSERKVVKTLLEDLKKVHGKTTLLFKIAEAAVESPDGVIKEVLYPVVGEQTLQDLVRENKATGAAYEKKVHSIVRASYGSHYRRMLGPLLQPILSRPINWDLIARQYDEMVKYATALRLGTAETEAILRRFTRDNLKHPTYQALLELGKVKRTMFLCRYLESEALRQEVHEALNVIERWNGTNGFIFFGKGGEVATNRLEDQEVSVLSLHLLQIALVYVNTLMIQNVLGDEEWMRRMAEEDFRALTPLIHSRVNPYGNFELDMEKRLPLDKPAALVA